MKRRSEIDLNKMDADSRMYYLQDLIADLADCVKDLAGDRPRHDYIQHTLEHAEQAVADIATMKTRYS